MSIGEQVPGRGFGCVRMVRYTDRSTSGALDPEVFFKHLRRRWR
jgi:hypothetical protein